MYKICGLTNYECNCGEDQVFGENLNLDDAIRLFISLTKDANSLDFSYLDAVVDDWAIDCAWEKDDYYYGSYGGSIILFDEAINAGDFDRAIVIARISRDPFYKTSEISEIEFGSEATTEEVAQYQRSK